MSTTGTTPGRAAYEAGGLGLNDAPWEALTVRDRSVWEEAAQAAIDAHLTAPDDGPLPAAGRLRDVLRELAQARAARDEYRDNAVLHIRERDEARAELARAGELIRRLERITTAWTRGMYAARIDCWRGDPGSAAAILSEGLDGYDGPEWDGTETGAQWWERTKAEEGL